MSVSSKKSKYAVAKVMHWIAAVIIGFNLLSGWRMGIFTREIKEVLLMIHSSVGTAIFAIMLIRWWWRRKHNLYTPPRWWKRPSMLLQWVFYPLVLMQVFIGLAMAGVIDLKVLGFGFIPYSSIAADDPDLHQLFLQMHMITAWVLILLIITHGIERWRLIFADDGAATVVSPEQGQN